MIITLTLQLIAFAIKNPIKKNKIFLIIAIVALLTAFFQTVSESYLGIIWLAISFLYWRVYTRIPPQN
jgi:hypothetical protein